MRSCRDNHGVGVFAYLRSRHADRAYGRVAAPGRQTELSEPGGGECGRYGDPVPEELNFDAGPERRALQAAVTDLGPKYGQSYFLEQARSGGNTDQLWAGAGKLGFLGVNLPEEYGGGGGRGVRSWRGAAGTGKGERLRPYPHGLVRSDLLPGTHPPARRLPGRGRDGRADDPEGGLVDRPGSSRSCRYGANIAKYAAAEAAVHTVDQAIQIHGGNGLSQEYGIAALLAMSRVSRIAPVSREMILSAIAQHGLRLPRSY